MFIGLFLNDLLYYILLCFVEHLFSLYICLVISFLVFIFMFGVASRLLVYSDFMNLENEINVVTANVDKPLSFPSRWSLQLKVYKVFSPGIVHHGPWNQFCPSVFFLLICNSAGRWAAGSTLSLEQNASMITLHALLYWKETFLD